MVTVTTERLLQGFVFLISLRRICAFTPPVMNEDFDCFLIAPDKLKTSTVKRIMLIPPLLKWPPRPIGQTFFFFEPLNTCTTP